MQSEEQKLKQKDEQIKVKDKNFQTKIEENNEQINDLPLINIRKISNLSDSVINYFAISIALFMNSACELKWFELENNRDFLKAYFLFAGVTLYIIGILNWYEGKELLFLFDFIFSFYFIVLFLCDSLFAISISDAKMDGNNKLQGIFYILFFCLILIMGISSKGKGIVFSINYAVLFCGFVFMFAFKFFGNDWIRKVYSYIFIVSAAFLWITGILKLINNGMEKSIILLDPTD